MQFAVDELRQNPNLTYVELKELASARGLLLPPILFGRAKLHLGLPTAPTLQRAPTPVVQAAAEAGAEADAGVAERTVVLPRPARREEPAEAPRPAQVKKKLPPPVAGAEDAEETGTAPASPAASAADMVAPRQQGSGAFEFAVRMLRSEPNLEYGDLRLRAEANGFRIPPILYGRAKAYLGLVPVKPRTPKAPKQEVRRGPLQLRQVESIVEVQREALKRSTGFGSIEELSEQLRQVARERDELQAVVRERDAMRKALEDIAGLVEALYTDLENS